MTVTRGGWWGSLTDVPGVRAGHAQRHGDGWLSGVTVVLPPPGTVGAVDVRGGGPATHETDALDPASLVATVDAVTLTGGSAYGLASARGVQQWCEEHGLGFAVGPEQDRGSLVVPIVPAAAVFDLGRGGDPSARPGPDLGYQAAVAAATGIGAQRGCIGAGTGAVLARGTLKGGVGTASVQLPDGIVVGALAVANAFGTPLDAGGGLLGAAFVPDGRPVPSRPSAAGPTGPGGDGSRADGVPGTNTTLAVVATNAALDPARTRRTAIAAQDGLARALRPAHTLLDGDTVFALATGELPAEGPALVAVQAAAADAVLLAVLDAVLAATATQTSALDLPGYLDRYPEAQRPA